MENLVCLVAVGLTKVLIIKLLNCKVLVRLTNVCVLIVVVMNCCSYLLRSVVILTLAG